MFVLQYVQGAAKEIKITIRIAIITIITSNVRRPIVHYISLHWFLYSSVIIITGQVVQVTTLLQYTRYNGTGGFFLNSWNGTNLMQMSSTNMLEWMDICLVPLSTTLETSSLRGNKRKQFWSVTTLMDIVEGSVLESRKKCQEISQKSSVLPTFPFWMNIGGNLRIEGDEDNATG